MGSNMNPLLSDNVAYRTVLGGIFQVARARVGEIASISVKHITYTAIPLMPRGRGRPRRTRACNGWVFYAACTEIKITRTG